MKRSVVLWLSLLALVASTSAWVGAQSMIVKPVDQPTVLSGADVGFRVEGWHGTTAVGKFVVRVNGQWVEAAMSGGTTRLAH